MEYWILLPILLPVAAGVLLLMSSFREHLAEGTEGRRGSMRTASEQTGDQLRRLHGYVGVVLVLTALLAMAAAWSKDHTLTLFYLMKEIPVYFQIDAVGRLFVTVVTIVWVAAGFYSFVYMKHEGEEKRFFGCYLLVYGILIGLDFSGNLVTMYLFYELMTLASMMLVLHNGSRSAIMAALKYLFYSMCGAYMGLFGIYVLYQNCSTLTFTAGGTLNLLAAGENRGVLLAAVFVMLIGFGAKAGMFPLHAWLPAAHPVAPSPASAVLSGIIVKSGVLAVVRVVYYVVGPDFLRGTWAQTAWMSLTLLTVFMGSLLAYREPVLKKRLAYSTVSQISYILFGLSAFTADAFTGAMLHTVFHAFTKCVLFLTAGVFLFQCQKTRVEELVGIGKKMPVTLWCYTFAALSLIGIPPASGFISKWYLAQGALSADIGIFRYLGPIVLLLSALLTAGYLLPVTMTGFFPGTIRKEQKTQDAADGQGSLGARLDPPCGMILPLLILAALTILPGIIPNPLTSYISRIASLLL